MTSTCWRLKKGKSSSLENFPQIYQFSTARGASEQRERSEIIKKNYIFLVFNQELHQLRLLLYLHLSLAASLITLCTEVKCNLEESS